MFLVCYSTANPQFSFIMFHCYIVIQVVSITPPVHKILGKVFDFGFLREPWYFNKEKMTEQKSIWKNAVSCSYWSEPQRICYLKETELFHHKYSLLRNDGIAFSQAVILLISHYQILWEIFNLLLLFIVKKLNRNLKRTTL